jgi:hypothetical protein
MHLATMTIGYKRSFESVPCMRCRAGSAGDVLEDVVGSRSHASPVLVLTAAQSASP